MFTFELTPRPPKPKPKPRTNPGSQSPRPPQGREAALGPSRKGLTCYGTCKLRSMFDLQFIYESTNESSINAVFVVPMILCRSPASSRCGVGSRSTNVSKSIQTTSTAALSSTGTKACLIRTTCLGVLPIFSHILPRFWKKYTGFVCCCSFGLVEPPRPPGRARVGSGWMAEVLRAGSVLALLSPAP